MNQSKTLLCGLLFSGAALLTGAAHAQGRAAMSPIDRGLIGDHIRRCLIVRHEAIPPSGYSVHLIIATDASGTARSAYIAPSDQSAFPGTALHVVAEQAIQAILTPQCSHLPVPPTMLGQSQQFEMIFRP
jgi:hypothetical protein